VRDAHERALALLRSWLSPSQLAMYDTHGHFEVMGSAGGLYRINKGVAGNVERLRNDFTKAYTLCFAPESLTIAGDCMLAQKIALEADELSTLKIAKKWNTDHWAPCEPVLYSDQRSRWQKFVDEVRWWLPLLCWVVALVLMCVLAWVLP
jgi:hypothetical protein